jgi:hypothetical protein
MEATMNINLYIEDTLAHRLNEEAQRSGEARNALIRKAIKEWLAHQNAEHWPNIVQTFKAVEGFPAFEGYRGELKPPKEDPLE